MIQSLLLLVAVGSLTTAAPSDGPVGPALLAALALLLCSSFFSGSETALFSLQPLDRNALAERGNRSVESLLARPRRTLASLLIGNEAVNVTLTAVCAGLVARVAGDRAWVNIVVLTPILLLLGEVVPKTLAFRYNRVLAPIVAPILSGFASLVSPIRWVLSQIAGGLLRLTGGSDAPQAAELREEHLRVLLDQGRQSGSIGIMEQEMIHKVFEFGDLTVGRLMTPRPDMFHLDLATPWKDLIRSLREAGYSRVPIWEKNPDNIIGVLVVKDLLPLLIQASLVQRTDVATPTARQIRKLLRPPHFVPPGKRAEDLLDEFRRHKFHLSLVVDEHGSVLGLVTLDDLLGELVGELLDESDVSEPEFTAELDGSWLVRAYMDVEDFVDQFEVALPEGEYNTVGGFVFAELGAAPKVGDVVMWEGTRFTVRAIEGRRILSLRFERLGAPAETDHGDGQGGEA